MTCVPIAFRHDSVHESQAQDEFHFQISWVVDNDKYDGASSTSDRLENANEVSFDWYDERNRIAVRTNMQMSYFGTSILLTVMRPQLA